MRQASTCRGASPVFEQVVGERAVQRLASQADRLMRWLQTAVPSGPSFALFGGRGKHIPLGFRITAVRCGNAKALHVRPAGPMPRVMSDDFGSFRAQLPVDEQTHVRTVRHAGRVHPVDLIPDLEPRVLHRAGEPMVRAAGGEHERVTAGFQHAQHLTPQADVERDARRIPLPAHEPKLIRRIRDHRIHAAARQRGQQFTAIPLIQADILAKRNHIHAYASRHCRAQATTAPSEHAAITAVDTRRMRPGNGMTHTISANRPHTSTEQPATTSRHRRRNRFASTRSCPCSCLPIYPCVRHARTRIDHHRTRSH